MTSRARAKQRRREAEASAAERAATLEGGREPRARETGAPAPEVEDRPPALVGIVTDCAIVLATFAACSGIAAAAGAANFGTALAFGQIGFAVALAFVLVRRR
jgi:hypothetical protein